MIINIIDIDCEKIHRELVRQLAEGATPTYCIMNPETLNLIREKARYCKAWNPRETYESIYNLVIATTPKLDFGEVDIV